MVSIPAFLANNDKKFHVNSYFTCFIISTGSISINEIVGSHVIDIFIVFLVHKVLPYCFP